MRKYFLKRFVLSDLVGGVLRCAQDDALRRRRDR